MIKRNSRLRREYLYKKTVQNEERSRLDRNIRIREALEKGTPVNEKDLLENAKEEEFGVKSILGQKRKREIELDNEYHKAGLEDPKILITTAHDPSDRLLRFMKEVKLIFPNCQKMNRGNQPVPKIIEECSKNGFSDLIVVHEHKGEPDGMIVCHLPYGPTAYFTLYNSILRHETNVKTNISEKYPHLIFNNFKTKLGERVATILKYLFPVPKKESNRIITFSNDNDFISFRHHIYKKIDGKIHLKEVGPRFELQLYEIKLGTLDQKESEVEWVLRPYMNTASKRQALGKSISNILEEKKEQKEKIIEDKPKN